MENSIDTMVRRLAAGSVRRLAKTRSSVRGLVTAGTPVRRFAPGGAGFATGCAGRFPAFFVRGLAAVCCLLAAACSNDDTAGPGHPLDVLLRGEEFALARSETAALRFSLSAWNAQWSISQIALTPPQQVGEPASGCTVTGWNGPVDGLFTVYVTAPDTEEPFDEQVCLAVTVGNRQMFSDPFRLRSSRLLGGGMPEIYVTSSQHITDTDTWIDGTVRIVGNGAFEDLPLMATKVKGRGNSSWKWDKKSYALKLSARTEVLGMPDHKRWCLIANYMDRTLLRNRVAFYISSHTSLRYTPRSQYAELFLNGEYLGNYLIVEQIKIDRNRLNIEELTPGDTEGDALTGGYLLEMDSYYDELFKFYSAVSSMPVNVKSPDEKITLEQARYIHRFFDQADNLLFDRDYRDPEALFDMTSFVDFWIVNELMGNLEIKHPKSFYVHKPRLGKLTAGPVWDFDYGTLTFTDAENWMCLTTNPWFARMFQSRKVRRLARRRWEAMLPFLRTVPDYIRAQGEYLAESAQRNIQRWPKINTGAEIAYVNGDETLDYEDAVNRLIYSYRIRLEWLDSQIRTW